VEWCLVEYFRTKEAVRAYPAVAEFVILSLDQAALCVAEDAEPASMNESMHGVYLDDIDHRLNEILIHLLLSKLQKGRKPVSLR